MSTPCSDLWMSTPAQIGAKPTEGGFVGAAPATTTTGAPGSPATSQTQQPTGLFGQLGIFPLLLVLVAVMIIPQVLAGRTDDEVLDWCFANGRRLTDEQVLIYNSFMSKRGWRDDETDGFIPDMIKRYGLKDDGSVITDFDLTHIVELGKWDNALGLVTDVH